MSWLFQPLAPAAADLLSGGPAVYNETGAGVFGAVASGADVYTPSGITVTDDFNRANGGIGSNWTQVNGTWTVSSNTANQTGSVGQYYSAVYTATAPTSNDYTVSADVENDTSGAGVGVFARASTSDVTGYGLIGFALDNFYLIRLNGGTETILAIMSAMASGPIYRIDLEVSGTTIRGRIDGGAWTEVTDSNISSGGWGIVSYADVTGGGRYWENFNGVQGAAGPATYTETGSGVCGFVSSGADAATMLDTGAGVFGAMAAGVGAMTFAESGGAVAGWVSSGAGAWVAADTGAGVWGAVASGAGSTTWVDAGGAVWGAMAAGVAAFTGADVGAGVFGWVSTGAESYIPGGGGVYNETGAVVVGWVAAGADILTMADGGHAAGALAAGGVGVGVWVDGGGGVAPWAIGGQDTQTMADGAAVSVNWVAGGAGALAMADGGAAVWGNEASGDDMVASPEPAPFPFEVRDGGRAVAGAGAVVRDGGRQVSQGFNAPRDGGRKTR